MKTRIFSLFLLGAFLTAPLTPALAQGSFHDWSRVQAVQVNERLIVKQKDGKTVEGEMIEASATNLTLSRDQKVVNIARDNIAAIHQVKGKANKTKWALIGTGVGAAIGAGIGATKMTSDEDSKIYVPIGAVFGAGAGAVAGLVIGATRRDRTLIYTAP